MAQKTTVQYVQFYTQGNAAQKIAPELPSKVFEPRKIRKHKRKPIYLDPVPVLGIVIAVSMLFTMLAAVGNLQKTRRQAMQMEQYIQYLEKENTELRKTYEDGYNLADIEKTALALGMVPQEQVKHLEVPLSLEETRQEPGFWQRVADFFQDLFA